MAKKRKLKIVIWEDRILKYSDLPYQYLFNRYA